MFYCCFVTFCWRKNEFNAISLLESACFSVELHRYWVQKPHSMLVSLLDVGSLDGVAGVFIMCSSRPITSFVILLPLCGSSH